MNVSAEQLEFVVREVVRRLSAASCDVSDSPAAASLHLGGNVLSVASLEGRLNGIERIVVGKKTIVTPAAIDTLNERSIELVRDEPQPIARPHEVVVAKDGDVGVSVEQLIRRLSATVRTVELTNCEQLGAQLNSHEIAILLTTRPYEAACHANRDSRICAVYAQDTKQCQTAMKEVAANVLVVNAGKCDKQLIATFLDAGGSK